MFHAMTSTASHFAAEGAWSLCLERRSPGPGSGPRMHATEVFFLAAALGPRCSNTHQSLQLSRSAMIYIIADGVSLLNVGSATVRTY